MKTIQPIDIWKDGQLKQASILNMYISYDDLDTTATFQYELYDDTLCTIVYGKFQISGSEYQSWGSSGDSNAEAYTYGASRLLLTITGDWTPPSIEPIIE